MGEFGTAISAFISGILVLSIISVIISKNAQTSSVINSTGSAFSSIIGAAVSPVTGSTNNTAAQTASNALGNMFG